MMGPQRGVCCRATAPPACRLQLALLHRCCLRVPADSRMVRCRGRQRRCPSQPSVHATAVVPKLQEPAAAATSTSPAPSLILPPASIYQQVVALGAAKANLPQGKTFIMSVLAGAYISFGALLAITVGGHCAGLAQSNPGLQKMVMGAFGLPFGLLMVLVCGAELFTGNTALVSAAVIERKAKVSQLLSNWTISYLGNLLGSLIMVGMVAATGVLATSAVPLSIAAAKTSLTFAQAFSRGVLANWLVCIAIWQASAASSLGGKAVAVWFPISAFVAMGLEHSVANMFMIPMGMALGAKVTVQGFLWNNLVPVTLGNILGGALCVATLYAFIFGTLGKQ